MTSADDRLPDDDPWVRMRAADADRELVHEILSAAMSSGALTPTEYQERAGLAVTAKTFGDLDALTDDLPVTQLGIALPTPGDQYPAPGGEALGPGALGSTALGSTALGEPIRHRLAIMSGSEVSGEAVVAEQLSATAIMGGVEIDLRRVHFTAPELTINCVAIMGGIEITVGPDVGVEVGGLAIMGGFDGRRASSGGTPGAPRVRVTGLALMGGVEVKRRDLDGGSGKRWRRRR